MFGITTVTTKGQVTIPQEIREALGISVGDKVLFKAIKKNTKEVTFRVMKKKSIIEELAGCLHKPGMRYIPIEEARDIAAEYIAEYYGIKKPNSS